MHDFLASNPDVAGQLHTLILSALQFALLVLVSAISWAVKLMISHLNSSWKQSIALRLASYAENKIAGDTEKMQYVSAQLHAHFPKLSQEEISHLLEEAVVNLQAKMATPITVNTAVAAPIVPPTDAPK